MAWPAVVVSAAARTAGHGMPCPYDRTRPASVAALHPLLFFLGAPAGAMACSHGWSPARRMAGGAQPVGEVRRRRARPGRGGGTSLPAGRQASPRRGEKKRIGKKKRIGNPLPSHGFRVGPLCGRAAPPAATIPGPAGAEDGTAPLPARSPLVPATRLGEPKGGSEVAFSCTCLPAGRFCTLQSAFCNRKCCSPRPLRPLRFKAPSHAPARHRNGTPDCRRGLVESPPRRSPARCRRRGLCRPLRTCPPGLRAGSALVSAVLWPFAVEGAFPVPSPRSPVPQLL